MQATPVRPFSGGTYDTAVDGGKASPVSIVENALRDATTLTTRIQALVEKLVGPHPVSAGKPNEADMPGTVFGNLANHARDVQSDIAAAHEALDFIEGQIS